MSRQLSASSAVQAAVAAVLVIGVLLLLVVNGHNDDVREEKAAERSSASDEQRELAGGFTTIPAGEFFSAVTAAQKASGGWHVAMATDENDQTVSVVNQDIWMKGNDPIMRGSTQGPSGPVVMIAVDGSVFFKGLGDQAKPWWEVPDKPVFAQLRSLAEQKSFLEGIGEPDDFEVVGVEKIDGTTPDGAATEVDALHYRIGVEAETYDSQGGTVPATVAMDVWVDTRDQPLQAITSYTVDGIRTETTLLYSDYGRIDPIKAPPANQVTRKVPADYRPGQ